MIKKNYKLARNAYATIQQEGLIGTKHIDIEPGDPTTGTLPPGSVLAMPGRPPTSVGDLLDQFKDIATGVQAVVESFKNTFGTRQGEKNLKLALDSVARATSKIASVSEVLERTLNRNEQNINLILQDFQLTAKHLSDTIPSIRRNFDTVSTSLTENTLPYISDASQKASTAFGQIGDTAENMRGTFKEAEEVVGKINQGKGALGKLINEDETYNDLKKTVKGFKEMVSKAEAIDILIDIHSESHFKTDNSKGYLEAKLRPSNDYFYNIQLVSDEYGSVRKVEKFYKRYDSHNSLLNSDLLDTQYAKMDQADRKETITRIRNDILFGFQFGKRFNRVALRIGMFENAFGAGIDYCTTRNR
jgi:phospholipid/cholesterol/gamma-HCH transport system substrate-binding protein